MARITIILMNVTALLAMWLLLGSPDQPVGITYTLTRIPVFVYDGSKPLHMDKETVEIEYKYAFRKLVKRLVFYYEIKYALSHFKEKKLGELTPEDIEDSPIVDSLLSIIDGRLFLKFLDEYHKSKSS